MWLFAGLFYTALFGPAVLLVFLWKSLLPRRSERVAVAIATLVSISYGYLMAALLFRSVLLGETTAIACLQPSKRIPRLPSVSSFSVCFENRQVGCSSPPRHSPQAWRGFWFGSLTRRFNNALRKGPFGRQLEQDSAQGSTDILKLHLLGPLQKAPQFFFGGHVGRVFFSSAGHNGNDSNEGRDMEGVKYRGRL